MNKQSVEHYLTFEDAASNAIESMKIWIYKSLHLVPDLDGLGDSSTTTPLDFDTGYTVTLDAGAGGTVDAYGWPLIGGKSVSFTTKPEEGWYHSTTDSGIATISSGGVAKYAGPQTEWTKETFDLGADVPANARIEFSAKNYKWEAVNIVLWNKTEWAEHHNDNWRAIVAKYRLRNWSDLEYKTSKDVWGNYDNRWRNGETPKLFNGSWMRYRIDFYGRNMSLYYSENGTAFTKVESFTVTDLINRDGGDDYSFLLRVTDPIVIDSLQVSTLKDDGTLAGDAGDILDLDFTDDIKVAGDDVANDDRGFDDDLNDAFNFGNW